ncbi:MAG: PQQ-binding-like beta-propeller repeat protein [Desulfobacteraceae bacterium]|nr:PQQ-binding-like beta-propeller repeat protein [Desulfobacteraceae bacterium]
MNLRSGKKLIKNQTVRAYWCAMVCLLCVAVVAGKAKAIDISDTPLAIEVKSAPANVMIIIDNCASMKTELITPEPDGLFLSHDDLFNVKGCINTSARHCDKGKYLNQDKRLLWKSQWCGYNRLYYNCRQNYQPWPSSEKYTFSNADLNLPFSNPMASAATDPKVPMAGLFFDLSDENGPLFITNAHYFTLADKNGNGRKDRGESIYLVTWVAQNPNSMVDLGATLNSCRRRFYRFNDNGDGYVQKNELVLVHDEEEKNLVRPGIFDEFNQFVRYKTDKEDLQNFANWFTYFRSKGAVLKGALGKMILNAKNLNIGLYALNSRPRIEVLSLNKSETGKANSERLMNAVYAMPFKGARALRSALYQAGRYFEEKTASKLGISPFLKNEQDGACQKAFAVIFSGGHWDDQFIGAGNADGDNKKPFADTWSNTLADISMHFYETDLAPSLADGVPVIGCDDAAHQHMVTHTVSFGAKGTLHLDNIKGQGRSKQSISGGHSCSFKPESFPEWPDPSSNPGARIDDLWHAAVNGRGIYFNVDDASELTEAAMNILSNVQKAAHLSDDVIIGQSTIDVGNAMIYQAQYSKRDWSGDLLAYQLVMDAEDSAFARSSSPVWRASDFLSSSSGFVKNRCVITYGGYWNQPQAIAFQYDWLSGKQRMALGSDLEAGSSADSKARNILNYIRGEAFDDFRGRSSILGDIVHSAPVIVGNTVYAGANDGMLHAFNASTGVERFAYVPNLVFDRLKQLPLDSYPQNHQFFVDGPVVASDVLVGSNHRKTYLTVGLGKGAKGYSCLCVQERQRSEGGNGSSPYKITFSVDQYTGQGDEHDISGIVKWEYPRPDTANDGMDNDQDGLLDEPDEYDPDIGYSYSSAYIENANCPKGKYAPVVIFGNGYNSASGEAVLYILDAEQGTIIRKIHTGAGDDNGLSTPTLIDVNLDYRVDYAYAGDLHGNLWKFDLTSTDPAKWGVAYGSDIFSYGVIDAAQGDIPKPVFQAIDQPITSRPDVTRMDSLCGSDLKGYMVFFGTGKYLGQSDLSDMRQQSLYGIWDYGDDNNQYLGSLTDRESGELTSGLKLVPRKIISQTSEDGKMIRQLDDRPIIYRMCKENESECNPGFPNKAGWFLNFPPSLSTDSEYGERVIEDMIIRGKKVIAVSMIPHNLSCSADGSSWIYILDGCSGRIVRDKDDEKILPEQIEHSLIYTSGIVKKQFWSTSDFLLICDSSGRLIEKEFEGEKWGIVFWRQNF